MINSPRAPKAGRKFLTADFVTFFGNENSHSYSRDYLKISQNYDHIGGATLGELEWWNFTRPPPI